MSASKLLLALLVATAILGMVAPPARGQDATAAAQALFDEAKRLMDAEQYDAACRKFEESNRLDPGTGTLLNLGVCYEQAGKTATSWGTFKRAQLMARREGREDRAAFAAEGIARLEPRLSRLTITVAADGAAPGLEVMRDGHVVGAPSWGAALPVDPGPHVVSARAPDHDPWSATVTVGEDGDHRTVRMPALETAHTTAAALPPTPPPPTQPTPPPSPPDRTDDPGGTQRVAGFVMAGIGGAATVVGLIFGGLALSAESDADELCGDGPVACPTAEGQDAADSAAQFATLANGFTFGGLGLVVVGVTVALVAPSAEPDATPATATLSPWAGPHGGGLRVEHRF